MRSVLLLLLPLCVLLATAARAQDAEALFQRLKDTYGTATALRAEFTQTVSSPYADDVPAASGTLFLRGDQYRVETPAQTLVTDTQTTWIYLPDENQVLINDYVEDETSFSPTAFFLTFEDRYDVTAADAVQHEGERHYRLRLEPRAPDRFFEEVTLWLRDRDTLVTRLVVLDANETRMTFDLDDVALDPALEDDLFSFTPPAQAEVVDLRS